MPRFDDLHLLPENDADPDKIRQYRVRVALVACSNWMFTFGLLVPVLLMLFVFGGLPVGRVVYAAELEDKVDARINQRIGDLEEDVAEIKEIVDNLTEANKVSAAASLGNDIIRATREKCKAMAAGRVGDAWAEHIITLRRKYRSVTGDSFETLTCQDV
jgi:hypothetical protein